MTCLVTALTIKVCHKNRGWTAPALFLSTGSTVPFISKELIPFMLMKRQLRCTELGPAQVCWILETLSGLKKTEGEVTYMHIVKPNQRDLGK